jgi:hypothetical protein
MAGSLFGAEAEVAINVQTDKPGLTIPVDFLGLSYEKTAIADKHFQASNTTLINLHRNLGQAVLRIGGNKVELCKWQPNDAAIEAKDLTPITPAAVDNFYAFIQAINWKVIYGVNLASKDPANSAAEIKYANKVGGNSTIAFEMGNEPDHYYLPPRKSFREKGYDYSQYKVELNEAIRAVQTETPNAPITGPANTSGGNKTFFEPCLSDFKTKLTFATSHFYPTSNKEPFPTIETLLSKKTEDKTIKMAEGNVSIARKQGLSWRLAECNSASLGGTPGVSDVYAAAVWGSDFLFDIAERGVAGINFHTILGTNGYTAISYDKKTGKYAVRPLYYALLLFKDAGHGKLLPTETKSSANVTAHATLDADHKIRVVVINKELTQAANVTITTGTHHQTGTIARLTGKSPTEKEAITYAGMTVTPEGNLSSPSTEVAKGNAGKFTTSLPPCSAIVLTVDGN